jgi:hypothetical protein
MKPEYMIVWVCEGCGGYYAATNAGDLREKFNYDIKGQPTFPRARCPTPACAAKDTLRVPYRIELQYGIPL